MKNQIKQTFLQKIDNFSCLDNIVFENRNKEYGAYELRKNHNKVLLMIVGFMCIITFGLYLGLVCFQTESDNTIDISTTGQIMTQEISMITVDIQEPSETTEEKNENKSLPKSSPPPTPNKETLTQNTSSSDTKYEVPTLEDDLIKPPVEKTVVTETTQSLSQSSENVVSEKNNVETKNVIVLKNKQEVEQFNKIKRRVKKVYPYAVMAQIKLKELEDKITAIQKNKDKKQLTEQYEEELRTQFGKEISKLSTEEGRVLMKLLDRNTGKTAYDIMKQFRGKFQAVVAQGIAKLFGQDLKSEYNKTEDIMIETAVAMVEQGKL